jgi:N-acetyl-alpha-D-muramate 1-phosphate uridylyltransferase
MTSVAPSIMLFAAGFGTRMGALTKACPKPLIPVAGEALIDHTLRLTLRVPYTNIVANTHYLPDMMRDHLQPLGVQLSHEAPEILETGGGLRAALPLLGTNPVITMNTDAIWAGPNPLSLVLENWDPDRMDALLMCVPVGQTVGHSGSGDFTADEYGQITRGPGLVYGGVQILKTDMLDTIPEKSFSLNVLWNQMMDRGTLYAILYPGRWCDVGHPEGIKLAEDLLADV